jgi:hypothetical protein
MSHLNPLWPTLFAVAGILLAIRETVRFRSSSDLAISSRLFLIIAASLAIAGFTDIIGRFVVIGTW